MLTVDFNNKATLFHFIGIGGISMSGLAELLLSEGFRVSGSDMAESELTDSLTRLGAHISFPQAASNINDDIDIVIYTAAIHEDNPELMEVRKRNIPALTRADFLGQLMKRYKVSAAVAGTHGKTTTTSMLSEILLKADTDPTLSIGGMLKSIGGNFRVGKQDFFVTEACEYTNSFLSFFPTVGVILNVDEDHLDFFKDLRDIQNSFHKFAALLPDDGTLIINGETKGFDIVTEGLKCNIVTYGPDSRYDYYPTDISFNDLACASFTLNHGGEAVGSISLKIPGEHNIGNACAAAASAFAMGIDGKHILAALSEFRGVDRRFQYKGSFNGVRVIDDYAHHPTEIAASLAAAKKCRYNKLWCVFQPHTYTRTKALLPEFAEVLSAADEVVLADIYAARETDTLGVSSKILADEISARGHNARYFDSFEKIENFLKENCIHGDLLITMGAGDVYKIGDRLLK
ncbi:MAG: UDP-N-acetylmuramate--L-alanine ligase [Lachnospiraceae bacterium]|nr:UDP-N-acetylmuramate--L-alanine ligase [Lachnospiraceae bacterium]